MFSRGLDVVRSQMCYVWVCFERPFFHRRTKWNYEISATYIYIIRRNQLIGTIPMIKH